MTAFIHLQRESNIIHTSVLGSCSSRLKTSGREKALERKSGRVVGFFVFKATPSLRCIGQIIPAKYISLQIPTGYP